MQTVLFTTRNRARMLATVLEHYCRLEEPAGGWKLVIVDNGSTDQTGQVIDRYRQRLALTHLFAPRPGKNVALNTGLAQISGDLILFTDDDTFPHPDWLVRMRQVADAHPDYSIFGGSIIPRWQLPPESDSWILSWVPLGPVFTITDPSAPGGPTGSYNIFGPNMAVRAEIFSRGYRFDPQIGPRGSSYAMGSETEFVRRLIKGGYRAWQCQEAVVEHFIPKSHMRRSWILSRARPSRRGPLVAQKNIRPALAFAIYSNRGWFRHSFGALSFMTVERWLGTVFVSLFGPGIVILIGLLVLSYFLPIIGEKTLLRSSQRTMLFACACAGLPIVILQLVGTNHVLRLISPAMIPLAVAVGVLSDATGWVRSRIPMAVSGFLFLGQFSLIVFPVVFPNTYTLNPGSFNGVPWQVMIRHEQWDWKPLQEIGNSCKIDTTRISPSGNGLAFNGQVQYGWNNPIGKPRIAYLGNGRTFNGSQIQYPWLAQGLPLPDVTSLWRWEDGAIDWHKVLSLIERSDLVITAPHYVGQVTDLQNVDNQYNEEFATRLSHDPRFQGPIRLEMGQLDPVKVLVFLKKSLVCH